MESLDFLTFYTTGHGNIGGHDPEDSATPFKYFKALKMENAKLIDG